MLRRRVPAEGDFNRLAETDKTDEERLDGFMEDAARFLELFFGKERPGRDFPDGLRGARREENGFPLILRCVFRRCFFFQNIFCREEKIFFRTAINADIGDLQGKEAKTTREITWLFCQRSEK